MSDRTDPPASTAGDEGQPVTPRQRAADDLVAPPSPARERPAVRQRNRRHTSIPKRMVTWLIFGVVFGLLPIIALTIKASLSRHGVSFDEVLGRGDLFVVSAVIAAGAIGEVLAASPNGPTTSPLARAGSCLLCLAANAMAFMSVDGAPAHAVSTMSFTFFLPTMIASGFCIWKADPP